MLTATHIAAYRIDATTLGFEGSDATLEFDLRTNEHGLQYADWRDLDEFRSHPDVNIGSHEWGDVECYLDSVARGNDD